MSLLLDTVVGWRSGARRLARPSAERIGRTTGPDNRLSHRWGAIGRAVLGGSSVGARVREDRGRDQLFVTQMTELFTTRAVSHSSGTQPAAVPQPARARACVERRKWEHYGVGLILCPHFSFDIRELAARRETYSTTNHDPVLSAVARSLGRLISAIASPLPAVR